MPRNRGGGYSGNDQSDQSEEGLVDETNDSGSDSSSSNEAGDTGNENGSTDETGDTGNGNGSSNETGDTGGGDGSSDETGDTGNGNGSSEETGDIGNGSGSSDETGDIGNGDGSSDETGDTGNGDGSSDETGDSGNGNGSSDETSGTGSGDDTSDEDSDGDSAADQPGGADGQDQTDENGGGEDDSGLKDGLEGETVETVSANDLAEPKAAGMSARAGGVTEISYEEASGTGVEIKASYVEADEQTRYSFTAPADGRYVFYTEEKGKNYEDVHFDLTDRVLNISYSANFNQNRYLVFKSDFMKQGNTVSIRSYTNNESGEAYTLKVARETSLNKLEDGSFNASLPNGQNITIRAEEGIQHFRFRAKASEGNWMVKSSYCLDNSLSRDTGACDFSARTDFGNGSSAGLLESGTIYNMAYLVSDSDGKFAALYTNTLATKTSDTDEGVYIHAAKTDVENSITLDVELLGSTSVYCYYAPEDGSEAEKSKNLYNGWSEVTFNGLKSGTAYKFRFQNYSGEVLNTAVYTTTGDKVEASTTGSSAVISDDFTTMTIKVKPEYNGTADSASLRYNIIDSLDRTYTSSQIIYIDDSHKDSEGYCSTDIKLTYSYVFLKPGESYQVEFYLDFQQDHVTTVPEVISVKAPEQAYIDPDQITFSLSQDEATRTRVNYDVQITGNNSGQAYIYYRPVGTRIYQTKSCTLSSSSSSNYIPNLGIGVTYEFLLYFRGATAERTLKLDADSGVELTRVEDAATDYTGPYDIVRTYKMSTVDGTEEPAGNYYLKLQYQTESGSYSNMGSSVELNADNGYQATVSSAERSSTLLQPDTDYTLKWMLGKSSSISDSNAEYCVYENIHTAKAKVTLEAGDNGCNYQVYTVKLDAGDIVNVKANSRSINLYGYYKAEGVAEDTRINSSIYLSSNNDYSYTLTLRSLAAGTRYELSLRDPNGKVEYAKAAFTTSADQRTVSVTSVDSYIDNAVINYTLSGFGEQTTDYILCYYREAKEDNSGTWKRVDSHSAKAASSMMFTIRDLKENTAYEYMIGIGTSSSTIVSNLVSPIKGNFTTRNDERRITVTSEKIMVTTARIEYALQNTEYAGNGYVHCYIKDVQSGENGVWERKDYKYYSASSSTTSSFYLSGLKENTAYEYKIGFGSSSASLNDLKNVISGSFTTYEDLRKISVTSVEPRMTTAVLNCAITGMSHADDYYSQYLVCFVQEKGSTEWKNSYRRSVGVYDNPAYTVGLTGLTSGMEYSYKIGFTNNYNAALENLVNVTEGTFTTYADTRKVEITGTTPRILSANIAYTLSGMEYAGDGYLVGYVKKKADDDTAWVRNFYEEISDQDTNGTIVVRWLEEKTEYELAVGFGDTSNESKENLKHVQTTTFTTLEDQRKLSDPKVSVNGTNAVLSVKSEGNLELTDTYVHFYYRVKGAANYTKVERVVNATRVKEKECSVTLTGLSKGTTYEFAAVLSESRYNSDEPDDVTKAEYKTEATEFTVEADTGTPVKPTAIKLSQNKLSLNANESYRNVRGYGYEILNVTVNPANATKGFSWKSSNESIITVSSGRVTAVAPGTATVTVTSVYDENVSAECEVTVGNYQLARKSGSGIELLDSLNLYAAKGNTLTGYTVCKVNDDGSTTETEFTVTSNNEVIASWNETEGSIESGSTGTTRLVFETKEDHVKLYLTVTVSSAPGIGFTVTGFTVSSGYKVYSAVQDAEYEYTLAYTPGISYQAEGEIVPKNPVFNKSDFNWAIDKTDIATVDEEGNVTPLKAGDAMLTVTPKEAGEAPYTKETCTVTLHIKSLASDALENATPVYALADICSTIGDVKFPDVEAWKGWEWKEPATPLVINGVNQDYYPFEAVYKGTDHYPEETTVHVYIAKITGISVYEDAEPGHNQVVEVGSADEGGNPTADSDSITLTAEALYYGSLNYAEATNYFCDVDIQAPADVVVKKNDIGTFTITATKKGNYTLTPVIKVRKEIDGEEKILAKTSYKIKAVEEEQAYIRLELEEPVPDGLILEDDRLIVDYNAKDELRIDSFKVKAELTDRNQANVANFDSAKLIWSVTDKKVATVTASADTRSAEVKVVGEGHTILTAKVKDAAGHKAELKVEIQNHKPRVNRSDANVNLAYDYDNYKGRQLAEWSSGAVEIVPVYGETIQSVKLYADEKAETIYSGLNVVRSDQQQHNWVISPTVSTKTGEGNYYLGVKTTFRDELYIYPLKVKVIEQQAAVTAKSARPANLFYRSDPGSLDIGIKGSYYGIDSVKWTDNSAGDENGFASEGTTSYDYDYTKRIKNTIRYYFTQQDILLTTDKKLTDSGIVSGTVEVQLGGYKKPNVVNTSLNWNYKKPVINTVNASITLIPEVPGKKSGYFRLYNKTEARYLNYRDDSYATSNPKYYYNELISNSENVRFGSVSSTNYSYVGSKTSGSEKFTVTLNGDDWREPLTAAHTIKLAAPKLYLTSSRLTMNTNRVGAMYTYVRLKNAYSSSLFCEDIIIKGKDAKSQSLLDQDLLEIRQGESDASQIVITENRASTMKQSAIANGSYTFTIAPCYLDADGNRISPKALSLKITVTDKAITARTKASGSLDLTKGIDDYNLNGNYIRLDTTFQNIGSYYSVTDSELVGEYSKYFNLHYNTTRTDQRLTIANESELKAGQKYKLAVRFTLRMNNGDTFTVTGAPFTVKPKQTAARIKVYSNNQILYAAADTVSRNYGLQVTNGDYEILSAEGNLDCNKDGRPDIIVSTENTYGSSYRSVTVRLADRDGVLTVTGAKGKTYTIPVTVKLRGRDGISKDVKTSIKVTVKR